MSTANEGDATSEAAKAPLTHQQLYSYLIHRFESDPYLDVWDMADYCVTHHGHVLQHFIDQEVQRLKASDQVADKAEDNDDDNASPNPDRRSLQFTLPSVAIDMVEAALMTAVVNRKTRK